MATKKSSRKVVRRATVTGNIWSLPIQGELKECRDKYLDAMYKAQLKNFQDLIKFLNNRYKELKSEKTIAMPIDLEDIDVTNINYIHSEELMASMDKAEKYMDKYKHLLDKI